MFCYAAFMHLMCNRRSWDDVHWHEAAFDRRHCYGRYYSGLSGTDESRRIEAIPKPARQSLGPARQSPSRPDRPLAGQTGRRGPDSLPRPTRSPCLSNMLCQVTLSPPTKRGNRAAAHRHARTRIHDRTSYDIRKGDRNSSKMVTEMVAAIVTNWWRQVCRISGRNCDEIVTRLADMPY